MSAVRTLIRSRRTVVTALLAAMLSIVGGIALGAPANATPTCNGTVNIVDIELPAFNGDYHCGMSRGAHSAAVRSLQVTLNICYWSGSTTRGHVSAFSTRLAEDSDFGGNTKAALAAAQSRAGASPDGGYGPETRSKILFPQEGGTSLWCARFGI